MSEEWDEELSDDGLEQLNKEIKQHLIDCFQAVASQVGAPHAWLYFADFVKRYGPKRKRGRPVGGKAKQLAPPSPDTLRKRKAREMAAQRKQAQSTPVDFAEWVRDKNRPPDWDK